MQTDLAAGNQLVISGISQAVDEMAPKPIAIGSDPGVGLWGYSNSCLQPRVDIGFQAIKITNVGDWGLPGFEPRTRQPGNKTQPSANWAESSRPKRFE
jgi:hypothetical protein